MKKLITTRHSIQQNYSKMRSVEGVLGNKFLFKGNLLHLKLLPHKAKYLLASTGLLVGVSLLSTKETKSFSFSLFSSSGSEGSTNAQQESPEKYLNLKENSFDKNKISYVFYPSNDPIEDRLDIKNLTHMKGAVFLAVLDGHGGSELSDFANKRLGDYIDDFYRAIKEQKGRSLSDDDTVVSAINHAFDKIENEYYNIAVELYKNGNGRLATVGSCVLVNIIYNGKLFIANLGDSKANIFRKENSELEPVKLMYRHNSEKKREKLYLYSKFPDEPNIVVCKRPNATCCYVKGRLQPTRSLGDFHLKSAEFNDPKNDGNKRFKRSIPNFKGPYILAEPEIFIHQLSKNDKYLLLATDGLSDIFTSKEVAKLLSQNADLNNILEKGLAKSAKEAKISLEQLKTMPDGSIKRGIHDDISIILYKF